MLGSACARRWSGLPRAAKEVRGTEQVGEGWARQASSHGIVRGVWTPPARALPDANLVASTCRALVMWCQRLRSRLV